MIVAIDAGNSAVKIASVEGGRVGDVRRVVTGSAAAPADLEGILAGAGAGPDRPIGLVSVVPEWTAGITDAAFRLGAHVVEATVATIPLPTRLAHPERVGADRLLAAWAARELYAAPVIVVDLGTATTVDGVDADGAFAGGAILPGPELAIRALSAGTALLPAVAVEAPARALGDDTAGAIQSGVVLGHVEAVSGLIRRIAAELVPARRRATVVLTGGGSAAAWAAAIRGVDAIEPDLVLRGLGLLAERQASVARQSSQPPARVAT